MIDEPLASVAMPVSALSARTEFWRRGLYRFTRSRLSVIGLVIVLALLVLAVFGTWVIPWPEHVKGAINLNDKFIPPSAHYWFGTNEVGQDIFSLTVAGAKISLLAGFAVVVAAATIGTVLGALAGYLGGWTDEVIMRVTDLILTLPSLILAMAIAASLGPGIFNAIVAITLSWWPGFCRLVRGEVMARKTEVYVQAAICSGASSRRIIFRHILPNIVSPLMVKISLDMGFAILTVAALGFVGIGVKPPQPEWGSMLSTARAYMPDQWWVAVFPGIAIFLAVLGFNLLGDGLRDVLDPKARR
ncbi:MAG: ABC transporter permease [Pseudomonas sp.]